MIQTYAIFLDAYRHLCARRLFWLTMILSALGVAAFALVGINEMGISILFWDIELGFLNTEVVPRDQFYKMVFTSVGIGFWLTWIAAILAIISTAGIFPEMISSGAIEPLLSKPIGRFRLYMTKYIAGLMFVALQVSVFTVACFLVIGIRGGAWEPALLLAIPIVVLFFSYLFSICVFFGVWTRSTITSMLLTLLIWMGLIVLLHWGETSILLFKNMTEMGVEAREAKIVTVQGRLDALGDRAETEEFDWARETIANMEEQLEGARNTRDNLRLTHTILLSAKTVLPKTGETVDLLERWLIDLADLPESMAGEDADLAALISDDGDFRPDDEMLQGRMLAELQGRSVWWVIGTSVLFEGVVVLLGAWVFCRRDY